MIPVRSFDNAEAMIAHAKACRERIRNAKVRPAPVAIFTRTIRKRQSATIYSSPIGPIFVRDVMHVSSFPSANTHQIIAEVCLKHGVMKSEIMGHRRSRPIVIAKREVCFRLRRESDLSFPQIGAILGKDHSTMVYNFYRHLDENPHLLRACERASLKSWREAKARNVERNSDYWHRCRKARLSKQAARKGGAL